MKFFALIVLVLAMFAALAQNVAAGKGHGAAGEAATTYVAAPVTYVAAPVKPPKVHKAPKQVVYASEAGEAGAFYGKAAKGPKFAN